MQEAAGAVPEALAAAAAGAAVPLADAADAADVAVDAVASAALGLLHRLSGAWAPRRFIKAFLSAGGSGAPMGGMEM